MPIINLSTLRKIAFVLSLVLLSAAVGYNLGTHRVNVSWEKYRPSLEVVNKLPPDNRPIDFSLFWGVWDELSKKYVDKTKLDAQKMVYGAISGMVAALSDPYTVFLPPEQNKDAKNELAGTFEGIGAQLGVKDKKIIVIAPLSGSPAERSGVMAGDWIYKVDSKETTNWTLPEAVAKIRGPRGTLVVLTVLRETATKEQQLTIKRETIVVPSVEWKTVVSTKSADLKPAIYLKVSRFGDNTDPQWDRVVLDIAKFYATSSAKTAGLVLDLRNNPGGLLPAAIYTASEFLPAGTVVVKQQSYTGQVQSWSVSRPGRLVSLPLVVLVNKGSASAAEILAGALQIASRGRVVGTQTFGKGSIQESSDLPGGAGLRITTAKWLLANDAWINSTGLTPDVKIENDEKEPTKDSQLDKAIEILNSP